VWVGYGYAHIKQHTQHRFMASINIHVSSSMVMTSVVAGSPRSLALLLHSSSTVGAAAAFKDKKKTAGLSHHYRFGKRKFVLRKISAFAFWRDLLPSIEGLSTF
jgi:hypothetical protein